jgi:hypothetical protein
LGAIAKAFDISPEEAARAVESGEILMDFLHDPQGLRFVAVRYGGRVAHIYDGAIRHAPDAAGG